MLDLIVFGAQITTMSSCGNAVACPIPAKESRQTSPCILYRLRFPSFPLETHLQMGDFPRPCSITNGRTMDSNLCSFAARLRIERHSSLSKACGLALQLLLPGMWACGCPFRIGKPSKSTFRLRSKNPRGAKGPPVIPVVTI